MSELYICDSRPHPHAWVTIIITDNQNRNQIWRDVCAYILPNLDRLFSQPDMIDFGLRYTIIPRWEVVPGPDTWAMLNKDGTPAGQ